MNYKSPLFASICLFLLCISLVIFISFFFGVEYPIETVDPVLTNVSGIDANNDDLFETFELEFINPGTIPVFLEMLNISSNTLNRYFDNNGGDVNQPINSGKTLRIVFYDLPQEEQYFKNQTFIISVEFHDPDNVVVKQIYSVQNFQFTLINSDHINTALFSPIFIGIFTLIFISFSFFPLVEYSIRLKRGIQNYNLKKSVVITIVIFLIFSLLLIFMFLND